jgi:hypothetical protein
VREILSIYVKCVGRVVQSSDVSDRYRDIEI